MRAQICVRSRAFNLIGALGDVGVGGVWSARSWNGQQTCPVELFADGFSPEELRRCWRASCELTIGASDTQAIGITTGRVDARSATSPSPPP